MNWKKLWSPTRATLTNPSFQYFSELRKSLKYSLRLTLKNPNFEFKDKLKNYIPIWVSLLKINPIPTRGGGGNLPPPPTLGLFVVTFDWVIQFCWNPLTWPKIYMEWIFQEKKFGTARVYGPGTNISTGGRIKILPSFKFPQIYMY